MELGALGCMALHPEREDSCGKETLVMVSYSYSFLNHTVVEKSISKFFMHTHGASVRNKPEG